MTAADQLILEFPGYPVDPESFSPEGLADARQRFLAEAAAAEVPLTSPSFSVLFYAQPSIRDDLANLRMIARLTPTQGRSIAKLLSLRAQADALQPLKADRPMVTEYLVGSRIADGQAPGGFARSENFPRQIPPGLPIHSRALPGTTDAATTATLALLADDPTPTRTPVSSGEIAEFGDPRNCELLVLPNDLTATREGARGMALYLVNPTPEYMAFRAMDWSLMITQEAMNAAGGWQPIAQPPLADGGNSYHRVFLEPMTCWKIAVPVYDGDVKTTVRYRLPVQDDIVLTSNAVPATIDAKQFMPECRVR